MAQHLTPVDAYEVVYNSRVGNDDFFCWMYPVEIARQHMSSSTHCTIDGSIDFAVLAEQLNTTLTNTLSDQQKIIAAAEELKRCCKAALNLMNRHKKEYAFPKERITICPPGANTFTYPHWDGSKLTMGGERGAAMRDTQRNVMRAKQRAARLRRAEQAQ